MSTKVPRWIVCVVCVVSLSCLVWHLTQPQPGASDVLLITKKLQAAPLGCGPATLATLAAAHDPQAASRLEAVLQGDRLASNSISSFYDLACWGRQVGLDLIGLRVRACSISYLPLPLIAHFELGHFVVIHCLEDTEVIISDQLKTPRAIRRDEFERVFSGYVLCEKRNIFGR